MPSVFCLPAPAEKHWIHTLGQRQRQTYIAVTLAHPTPESPSFIVCKVLSISYILYPLFIPCVCVTKASIYQYLYQSIGYFIGIDEYTFSYPKKLTSI